MCTWSEQTDMQLIFVACMHLYSHTHTLTLILTQRWTFLGSQFYRSNFCIRFLAVPNLKCNLDHFKIATCMHTNNLRIFRMCVRNQTGWVDSTIRIEKQMSTYRKSNDSPLQLFWSKTHAVDNSHLKSMEKSKKKTQRMTPLITLFNLHKMHKDTLYPPEGWAFSYLLTEQQ